MNKIINPLSIKIGEKWANVFCKIKIEDGILSITGVIGPLPNGNTLGGGGQIGDDIKSAVLKDEGKIKKGWTKVDITTFLSIWKNWHLNDLHPGCEHQRDLGWELDSYEKHPSEPCPTCGYKFGTEWKKIELPENVIKILEELPVTKKEPAWV